jgi:hypothetical protein
MPRLEAVEGELQELVVEIEATEETAPPASSYGPLVGAGVCVAGLVYVGLTTSPEVPEVPDVVGEAMAQLQQQAVRQVCGEATSRAVVLSGEVVSQLDSSLITVGAEGVQLANVSELVLPWKCSVQLWLSQSVETLLPWVGGGLVVLGLTYWGYRQLQIQRENEGI